MISLADTIVHLFVPRHTNNHRAKLTHSTSLVIFALLLVLLQSTLQMFTNMGVTVLGYAAYISKTDVVDLTNQKRLQLGLQPLEISADLEVAARAKAEDMLKDDYWSHVAPDGTEPWAFFASVNYDYRYAGENLARDFSNAHDAVEAWMASPTHRENMLSANYNEIGIAVVEGDLDGKDTTLIVQLFGTRADSEPTVPVASAVAPPAEPFVEVAEAEVNPVFNDIPIQQIEVAASGVSSDTLARSSPLITIPAFTITQTISFVVVGLLIAAFVVDGYVVAKRGISRTGGKLFAHISFLGMVMAIILIARAGQIL